MRLRGVTYSWYGLVCGTGGQNQKNWGMRVLPEIRHSLLACRMVATKEIPPIACWAMKDSL